MGVGGAAAVRRVDDGRVEGRRVHELPDDLAERDVHRPHVAVEVQPRAEQIRIVGSAGVEIGSDRVDGGVDLST